VRSDVAPLLQVIPEAGLAGPTPPLPDNYAPALPYVQNLPRKRSLIGIEAPNSIPAGIGLAEVAPMHLYVHVRVVPGPVIYSAI
jgi:hypothetical protein